MLESGLVPWGEGAHRRGGGGIEGVARGKSPFRQRFSFSPSWAMSVTLRPGSPLLSSSPLSLDSGSISESDFTWPGPFCANCKALFFVIIIFFFFFGIQNLLTGKSVLEVGEAYFLLHAKAITGCPGRGPRMCAHRRSSSLPCALEKCVQLSAWSRPGGGNANQATLGSVL